MLRYILLKELDYHDHDNQSFFKQAAGHQITKGAARFSIKFQSILVFCYNRAQLIKAAASQGGVALSPCFNA
jgi:hypothetical protein